MFRVGLPIDGRFYRRGGKSNMLTIQLQRQGVSHSLRANFGKCSHGHSWHIELQCGVRLNYEEHSRADHLQRNGKPNART